MARADRRFRRKAMRQAAIEAGAWGSGRRRIHAWQARNLATVRAIDRAIAESDTMDKLQAAVTLAAACRFVPAVQHELWQAAVWERLFIIKRDSAPIRPPNTQVPTFRDPPPGTIIVQPPLPE